MPRAARSWTSFFDPVLGWVYPQRCALCARIGFPTICDLCFADFSRIGDPVPVGAGPIRSRASLFLYTGRAAQAVQRLKYERATSLIEPMARMVAEYAGSHGLDQVDAIVPVPIHWRRRWMRGFNQAEMLCAGLDARLLDVGGLVRVRATKPQVGLNPTERGQNLQGAFRARRRFDGQNVLLVDDVSTSGHTMTECARTLVEAGAERVSALSFCSAT